MAKSSSIYPSESVKVVGDTLGLNVSDGVASFLAADVEYRLREIIQDARKFMVRSRRSTLLPHDINAALQLRQVPPVFGYSEGTEAAPFLRVPGHDLFFVGDKEMALPDLINAPLPAVPLDISFTGHWLAIEGTQPAIPQNPISAAHATGPQAARTGSASVTVATTLTSPLLSAELQAYFDTLTQALSSGEAPLVSAALHGIATDSGIAKLTPFLVQYLAGTIAKGTKHPHGTDYATCLQLAQNLLDNDAIFIEPYLHQFMPSLLTCLLAKHLVVRPAQPLPEGDPAPTGWDIRHQAARLLKFLWETYGEKYPSMKPRVAKTCCRAWLDPTKPFTTHYGALLGLADMGAAVVETLVLPNLGVWVKMLRASEGTGGDVQQESLAKCRELLVSMLRTHLPTIWGTNWAQRWQEHADLGSLYPAGDVEMQ